jgi:UPF0716 family protein affecting phage T7 exclusion
MREELGFWLTVAIVAIVAVVGFKVVAATRLGDVIPGARRAAAVI